MKNAAAYIDIMLEALSVQFPTASICYAFSKQERMHIIDMKGASIEELDADKWVAVYNDFVDDFENKFVNDSLLFVREGSLVRVSAAKADKIIEPEFVPSLPTSETSVYSWVEKPVRYVYDTLGLAKQKAKRKRRAVADEGITQANESTYNTLESVLMHVGTDSFCGVL
jgi:hypothetical protein